MSDLFLRQASLTVIDKFGVGKDFSGLRVTFKVTKTAESNANKATINVYNLSPDSRKFLEQEELKVILAVGYRGIKSLDQVSLDITENLFIGDISKDEHGRTRSKRTDADWVTTLECGDAEKALTTSHADVSFGPGTPFTAIISQLIKSLGVDIGNIQPVAQGITLNGFVASGRAKDIIDRLAKRFGFDWSVQNNAVQIVQAGQPTQETAVVLSPQNGLIGSVAKRGNGIEFSALINPQIRPGRAVSVIGTQDINGFFKVQSAVFDGDTHGQQWSVQVEASSLGGGAVQSIGAGGVLT